jgi:hypothetical protein
MKGSIRERSPGHFAIILDAVDLKTGKRKRRWHSFKGTKRQAQIECSRLITGMKDGGYVEPSKVTVLQFLERWLLHIKPNISPRTHERYRQLATKNIAPLIGSKVLSKLQPIDISTAYAKALESGRRDAGRSVTANRPPYAPGVVLCPRPSRTLEDGEPQSRRPSGEAGPAQDREEVCYHHRRINDRNRDGCCP